MISLIRVHEPTPKKLAIPFEIHLRFHHIELGQFWIAGLRDMHTHEVSDFNTQVLGRSYEVPVVVDFWAEWCGPCKVLGPILERLERAGNGRWILAKVDTDRNQDLAEQYGIRGIPAVKLFVGGQVVSEFTGALPEVMLRKWLAKSLPDKNKEKIASARSSLSSGLESEALATLMTVLEEDRDNVEARILLAVIHLFSDPEQSLSLVTGIEADSEHYPLANAVHGIATLTGRLGNAESFPEGGARSTYVEAIEYLKSRRFEEAVRKFIDVIRMNREYDEDGARKAVVAIFRILGEEHQVTQGYRREFGSALNA